MTNLASLLKNAPSDLILYSVIFGDCTINVQKPYIHCCSTQDKIHFTLNEFGQMAACNQENTQGECLLFPTKEYRVWDCWQKMVIKPGTIVVKDCKYPNVFLKKGQNVYVGSDSKLYEIHDNDVWFATQKHIKQFEEEVKNNGFKIKDNDVVKIQYPTTKEALMKKQVLDFEPFQKIIVRDNEDEIWHCSIFSHIDQKNQKYKFATVAGVWKQCLPYNEITAHLIGTTIPFDMEAYQQLQPTNPMEGVKYNIEIRKIDEIKEEMPHEQKLRFTKILKDTYGYYGISLKEAKNVTDSVLGYPSTEYQVKLPYMLPFPALNVNEAQSLVSQLKEIGIEAKFI